MTEIRGARVVLRSLTFDDVDALADEGGDGSLASGDADVRRQRLRSQIEKSPTLADDGFVGLGVEHDGELVGDIQARSPRNGFPPGVCEIGITLFADRRGKGVGREAVEIFTAYLLEQGVHRAQATTAVDNVAMRRVLENAGYAFEGVLASYAPDDTGGRSDYAMYAVVSSG